MKLPNPDKLVVERDKIADYLLNPVHRFGASKARFFTHFGFHAEAWEQLAQALREHGQKHDVTKMRETGFGPRYEVEFVTLAGKTVAVATVEACDLRPVGKRDLSHVRELQAA